MFVQSDRPLGHDDQARLDDQKQRLGELTSNPELRERLNQWHEEREGLDIVFLDDAGGDRIGVEAGVILAEQPDTPEGREELVALLEGMGFRQGETEPDEPIIEFVAGGMDAQSLLAALTEARGAGFTVGPSHLLPLNWRMKGKDGPEPTETPLPSRQIEDGAEPLVVVIDTGIAPREKTYRTDGWLDDISGETDQLDIAPDAGFLDLGAGHGTYVASIVRFVAPNARVHVLRATVADGLATERAVARKIRQAAAHIRANGGRGVINLSLGETTLGDQEPVGLKGALASVEADDGIAVVASAGNSGDTRRHWPAAFDSVIAVAALERDLDPAPWSTSGSWVDFATVGEGLIGAFVIGEEQESQSPDDPYDPDPDKWEDKNPNALWLGTSFAAPQVAAWIADFLATNTNATKHDAVAALGSNGIDSGDGFGRKVRIL